MFSKVSNHNQDAKDQIPVLQGSPQEGNCTNQHVFSEFESALKMISEAESQKTGKRSTRSLPRGSQRSFSSSSHSGSTHHRTRRRSSRVLQKLDCNRHESQRSLKLSHHSRGEHHRNKRSTRRLDKTGPENPRRPSRTTRTNGSRLDPRRSKKSLGSENSRRNSSQRSTHHQPRSTSITMGELKLEWHKNQTSTEVLDGTSCQQCKSHRVVKTDDSLKDRNHTQKTVESFSEVSQDSTNRDEEVKTKLKGENTTFISRAKSIIRFPARRHSMTTLVSEIRNRKNRRHSMPALSKIRNGKKSHDRKELPDDSKSNKSLISENLSCIPPVEEIRLSNPSQISSPIINKPTVKKSKGKLVRVEKWNDCEGVAPDRTMPPSKIVMAAGDTECSQQAPQEKNLGVEEQEYLPKSSSFSESETIRYLRQELRKKEHIINKLLRQELKRKDRIIKSLRQQIKEMREDASRRYRRYSSRSIRTKEARNDSPNDKTTSNRRNTIGHTTSDHSRRSKDHYHYRCALSPHSNSDRSNCSRRSSYLAKRDDSHKSRPESLFEYSQRKRSKINDRKNYEKLLLDLIQRI